MSRSSGTTRRRRRHGQPAACEAKRYAICGIENHGFRGVTNGNKKLASNAKRYPLCENKRIPFTRNPSVSCLLGRCPNPRRTQFCVLEALKKSSSYAILQIAKWASTPVLFRFSRHGERIVSKNPIYICFGSLQRSHILPGFLVICVDGFLLR